MNRRTFIATGALMVSIGCTGGDSGRDDFHEFTLDTAPDEFEENDVLVRDLDWGELRGEGLEEVTGVVEHTGDEELAIVSLFATFFAGDRNVGIDITNKRFVGPGEWFQVRLTPPAEHEHEITRFRLEVAADTEHEHALNDNEIAVSEEQFEQDGDVRRVTGNLENQSDQDFTDVIVYINFYDDDEIVASSRQSIPSFGAGQHAQFSIETSTDVDRISDYKRRIVLES